MNTVQNNSDFTSSIDKLKVLVCAYSCDDLFISLHVLQLPFIFFPQFQQPCKSMTMQPWNHTRNGPNSTSH